MRLWTLHPELLDARGLLALWREGLLARAVLLGKTKGYRHHPQLIRFRRAADPRRAIDAYLFEVLREADRRGYRFDRRKIRHLTLTQKMPVTRGQIAYEFAHLKRKLAKRDPTAALRLSRLPRIKINKVFREVPGPLEPWEHPIRGATHPGENR
jgi:hypothetical protein